VSKVSVTGSYPEPAESSPHTHMLFKIHFFSAPCVFQVVSSGYPTNIL